MDFPDIDPRLALVSSGRDLDAPKRSRDVANPKKRMLGVTPRVVLKVDTRKTPKASLWRPRTYLYMFGRTAKDDKIKSITFLSDK